MKALTFNVIFWMFWFLLLQPASSGGAKTQASATDEMIAKYNAQLKETARQTGEASRQMEVAAGLQKRYAALLELQEANERRHQVLLQTMEREAGIRHREP